MKLHPYLAASALAIAAVAGLLSAGPLDPPAGSIAPTYKTLSEVEPRIAINAVNTPGDADSLYKITQPGSYYLTGNLTGTANDDGIEVSANDVTIDLNGFAMVGLATSKQAIDMDSTLVISNFTIVHGSVRSWPDGGIMAADAVGGRIADIDASSNGDVGIAAPSSSVVENCVARSNTGSGITCGDYTVVSRCTSKQNMGAGFFLGQHSSAIDCVAGLNNDYGIQTTSGCLITHCNSDLNGLDGIFVSSACAIVDNLCRNNGTRAVGAGVNMNGSDNRVEGNHCIGADRGIFANGPNNFIVRNTCVGNGVDWLLAANNVHGPIIDRRAPASASVNGASASSSLGSTDANANYSH